MLDKIFTFKYKEIIIFIFLIFFSTKIFSQAKIVIVGDSLTEGFGIRKEESFPDLLQLELIKRGYEVNIINGGVSGSTSASAFTRLKWYIRIQPDIVILALGGNDGLRGLSLVHMKKNLIKAIELAKSKNIKIILAGMQIPLNYGKEYTKSFSEVYFELAKEYNLPLIPFLLKDVGGVSSLNLSDGIHPNPEGHKIIAKNVLKYLKPHLVKKK